MRRLFCCLLLPLLLAACAGGPPKRVYPPQLRIQELTRQAGGDWQLQLRLESFSNVPMRFDRLDAHLQLAGIDAGSPALPAELRVGPGSAEVFSVTLHADPPLQAALDARLQERTSARYRLSGSIHAVDPEGDHEFDYESALDPVPGLDGVLR